MKKFVLVITFVTILCAFCARNTYADNKDDDAPRGTSAEDLAKLKERPLPQPHDLKVAILPLWDASGSKDNTYTATASVWLLWQKEGFNLTPILDGFKARDEDGDVEPGMALRKEDAIRIGEKLGVDWVVYGEVLQLEQSYKQSFFMTAKYVRASLRIAIAEVPHDKSSTGSIIYWQIRNERRGGGRNKSGDTLKRLASIVVAQDILQPFFDAFPEHKHSDEKLDTGDVAKFVDETWPKVNLTDK